MINTVTNDSIYESIKEYYGDKINLYKLKIIIKGDNYGRFSNQGTGIYKHTYGNEVSDGRTN